MRRPRIALWIKRHPRWVPDWTVRWALRRVGKWNAGYAISPFSGRLFRPEDPIDWPDR